MSKERREAPRIAPMTPLLLLSLGAVEAMLGLFQWMELIVVRSGGQSVCSVNQILNCEQVWNLPISSRVHQLLGIPVAGLGIVWGATAFGASALLAYRMLAGSSPQLAISAVRLTGAAGILGCITFAASSLSAGAVCLTCLGTYVLVLLFVLAAIKLLPGPLFSREELIPSLRWCAGLGLAAYLLVLGPGLSTPKPGAAAAAASFQKSGPPMDESAARLKDYLLKRPKGEQQAISDALSAYRRSSAPASEKFGVRNRHGPANAPVKIVEFTDLRCSHCAELVRVMKEIERVVPEGRLAVEARNFPLDAACNPSLQGSDQTGVRCLGAKTLICLEQTPDFWALREKLFQEQESLTPARVLEIASSGSVGRQDLEKCINSANTERLLKEDIDYAMQYSPNGTPIILINGREAPFLPSFLFAMVMTGANPQSPALEGLPPPRSGVQ